MVPAGWPPMVPGGMPMPGGVPHGMPLSGMIHNPLFFFKNSFKNQR